jgi:tRNA(fMet)-specific endonuclease VapC
MAYLLDTNICIALLKGRDTALVRAFREKSPDDFSLCSIVKAELLFGARNSARVNDNLRVLEGFFKQFESLPFDDGCAEHYGIIRSLLQRAGTPIGANDLIIAGTALCHDHVLLTRNRDEFLRVPGLRVETW